jgi:sulfate transport system substrate-binding protein
MPGIFSLPFAVEGKFYARSICMKRFVCRVSSRLVILLLALLAPFGFVIDAMAAGQVTLLNVSYDVARELYKEVNPAFAARWQAEARPAIEVRQSHGGSSRQAHSVAAGLEADVVTMNQAPDIDLLVDAGLVAKNWRQQFPYEAVPYTTVSVFLVRKGNPKNIRDWQDLARPGISVIIPNPKTSGNGRYTYLGAWGYALKQPGGTPEKARQFITALFRNVPVLDGGGRGASTTFAQRGMGDVLITFENEAILIAHELGEDAFEVVYPSLTIEAAAPVAVVETVTRKRDSETAARAYLDFLFSRDGQEIIARHHFRPQAPDTRAKYARNFPPVKTLTVEKDLGGWRAAQQTHFADGGLYDQISASR